MWTCERCGATVEPGDPARLAWSVEREPDGRDSALCPACAREHVRDIEARLPREWW
ncbi:hypothetical protein ACQP04_18720 [Pseudonocardia halophobica]|uniref:hypothetical protein n=1 Tax=Pseudonocardia halophobica TaxID=29401 RepID=UPI003D92F610